ncbi:uncharacterized protein AFUA_1G02960 [Aspergillus fumigatus Af293]
MHDISSSLWNAPLIALCRTDGLDFLQQEIDTSHLWTGKSPISLHTRRVDELVAVDARSHPVYYCHYRRLSIIGFISGTIISLKTCRE